jgi:hypothetical protein
MKYSTAAQIIVDAFRMAVQKAVRRLDREAHWHAFVKRTEVPKSTTSPCLDPLGSLKRRHRTKAAPKKVL